MTRFGAALGACFLVASCARGTASPSQQAIAPRAPTTPAPAAERHGAGHAAPDAGSVLAPAAASNDADTPEARVARYRALWKSPRHRPAALDAPPRTARLAPGAYLCKVSREYRLRDCSVERDAEGRTFLEFSAGNLLGMRGVVSDSGSGVLFEGWLTDDEPFGCSSCQERCVAHPGTCACDPLPPDAVVECLKQPLRMTLRPAGGGKYRGTLRYDVYYNEYVGDGPSRHPEGYVPKPETFEVELVSGPKNVRKVPARQ